ncbi:Extradiol ring-cleavage dioxygenase, class III enzyme, subunit B [Cadophora sp. MPI-SDFR-AT-0126]|nr:Extradiol ring-cleavage dioxygenase, class III enzyme, subunit B [Leotiomycetes sp. MPI-SDFR-AT-0126]
MTDILAPAVFFTHGAGPLPALDEPENAQIGAFLRSFEPQFDGVKGIVIFTAHWANEQVQISSGAAPELYFDYQGFPPAAFEFRYPAPGDPGLAQEVQNLLAAAGIPSSLNSTRGWDHGVFIPLLLSRPKADIPVVQVSIKKNNIAADHVAIGVALQSLRKKGIAIVGSGASFHNMNAAVGAMRTGKPMERSSIEFESTVKNVCCSPKAKRNEKLARWEEFPDARFAYPDDGSEDHFMPLCIASGAGSDGPGKVIFEGMLLGGACASAFSF